MPTYEYRCRDCGREFEVFQRMSDRPGAPCPDCGRRAERLISGGAGFLFRGDGFYITDHRSEEYRRRARQEADGGGGEKAGGGPEGEEAKPPRDRAGQPVADRPESTGRRRGEKAPPVPGGPDRREPRGDPAPAGSASEPGNGVAGDEST